MGLAILLVGLLVVAAFAVAAGVLDRPRRERRRVIVHERPQEVLVERPAQTVVTERRTVTEQRDPLL